MNPTTIDCQYPRAIQSVVKAENSPRVRICMEHWTGRNKWMLDCFRMETDPFGNQFLNTDKFAIEGSVIHATWLARHFWARVKTGELGINPRVLFRLPAAPQQTVQSAQSSAMSAQPSPAVPSRTN